MLRETKPMLESIAGLEITREQSRGVSLYWHEDICRHSRGVANDPKPIFLFRERPWDHILPMLGIATRFGPGGAVTALAGEQVDCLDETALNEMFSRGVLLDARGAESLLRSGHGDLAGIVRRTEDAPAIVECVTDAAFGDYLDDTMSCRWMPKAWQFELAPGARAVSRLIRYGGHETGHGMTLFENRLGGRVAIFPFDSQIREVSSLGMGFPPLVSPSMLTWTRQAQLRAVLQWLGREPLPLFVFGAPNAYPLLAEQEKRLIVGVANLGHDRIEELSVEFSAPPFAIRSVQALQPSGKWKRSRAKLDRKKGVIRARTSESLGCLDVSLLRFERSPRAEWSTKPQPTS
jgi:hypothetical protein